MGLRALTGGQEPRVVGAYELHQAIAEGGMATVHLGCGIAREAKADIVAIKRLRADRAEEPELVTMFLDEARLTAQIRHPNVAQTYEVISDERELFIVMEYVVGETLSRLTRSYALPSFDIAARVIIDVLLGLHAAHVACGEDGEPLHIIHRDISPQNILVGVDGVTKLIDFGVAKAVGRMAQTREGEIKGKIAYMPPEQLVGRSIAPQADIYSTGVVLWELLTGRRLFRGDNEGVIVTKIIRGEIPRVREIWQQEAKHTLSLMAARDLERIDAVTMRALSLDPEDRFASAEEMALALEEALRPAARDEVATWVRNAAGERLGLRADLVSEIAARGAAEPPTLVREDSRPAVLVANLTAPARDFVVRVARTGGTIQVPLAHPPPAEGEHVLEVHVTGEPEPQRFRARVAGPPGANGVPLTLTLDEPPTTEVPTQGLSPLHPVEKSDTFTVMDGETRDLTSMDLGTPVEADVLGRVIAKGSLELEARIGGGGGGAVYRACHRELRSKIVAVKVLHESAKRDLEFTARFHAEALAASHLDHANVVRVLDFGQEPDGLLYLVMEFLNGSTVRQLIDHGRVAQDRAVGIMLQICAGLAHAHAQGVIHRDIKPSNVLLVSKVDDDGNPREVVKVCDFGIAVQRSAADAPAPKVAGTPGYMPPEQLRGVDVDARSDVYSCGVMLYELVTGRLPYAQRDDVNAPPPSRFAPDLDVRLERIIMRAIAREPAHRFATMLELRAALKAL